MLGKVFPSFKAVNEVVLQLNEKINELSEEKKYIENASNFHRLEYREILLYLRDVIEKQSLDIERLEELMKSEEAKFKERLRESEVNGQKMLEKVVADNEKIKLENLLMKTQQNAYKHMKLEMEGLYERIEEMKKVLEEKNEKISKKELKEREVAIITSDKVKKEMEIEYAEKIAKIKEELQVQNMAELCASNEIGRKLKEEIKNKDVEINIYQDNIKNLFERIEEFEKTIENYEKEREKMRNQLAKVGSQTEKSIREYKKLMEACEKSKSKEIQKREKIISELKKENENLKKELHKESKKLTEMMEEVVNERTLREQTVEAHKTQNQMLNDLKTFLNLTLGDTSNQEYIDTIFSENRIAIFAKLALLVQNIPQLDFKQK
uniref:Cilia- and flagella-associated protein 157 n=1 Tax=Strongyloides stercoralis TaxID=6248 RepID=A0A0K0E0E7_STRER